MLNNIKIYKENNSIIEVAQNLGLEINKEGKCCCPFHNDKHPSMKLYEDTNKFYCFACGAKGDVVDLVKKITGKTINEIVGCNTNKIYNNEEKLINYAKNNIKYLDDISYRFDRAHLYKNEKNDIVSIKIIYKNQQGNKKALQFSIENNYKIVTMKNHCYLYNYYNLIKAIKEKKDIYIVEGEKDADTINKLGLIATTSRYGANKVKDEELKCLYNANVIIIPDNDEAGKLYANAIKEKLIDKVNSLKIIELPYLQEKQDITDWINMGHNKSELEAIVDSSIDFVSKKFIEECDFSDFDLLEAFIDKYSDTIKYCSDTREVIFWENERWNINEDGTIIIKAVKEFIHNCEKNINEYLKYVTDNNIIKKFGRILKNIKSSRMINFLEKNYASEQTNVKRTDFDKDMQYILCKNGIIDILKGQLIENNKKYRITEFIDINYTPFRRNELFYKSIRRMFNDNDEEIEAFENLIGYMLSGQANQKVLPVVIGEKNTGKSMLFELIKEIMGANYVKAIDKALLCSNWNKANAPNSELVNLFGTRLAICTETGRLDYLNSEIVKKLVGRDTISARDLYKTTINFIPSFVPVIFTNFLPKFDKCDEALAMRLLPIVVSNSLSEDEIDINYKEKVLMDKEGLFSYLIDCIIKYNKNRKIIVPDRWKKNKEIMINSINPIKKFVDEKLVTKQDNNVDANEVYNEFLVWKEKNMLNVNVSKTKFTQELKRLNIENYESNGKTRYKNIEVA